MQRHLDDPYVRQARQSGYRSRSSFKLKEMDERYRLFAPGMTVVDLGAAPGGWSQVAVEKVSVDGKLKEGQIIALDILSMEPINGVEFIQGDFEETEVLKQLVGILGNTSVDLVISDIAPNLSGIRAVDQAKSTGLVELVLNFADQYLTEGGVLLAKCFEGEGISLIREEFRKRFRKVVNFKPKSSRDASREIYLIGLYYVK